LLLLSDGPRKQAQVERAVREWGWFKH